MIMIMCSIFALLIPVEQWYSSEFLLQLIRALSEAVDQLASFTPTSSTCLPTLLQVHLP